MRQARLEGGQWASLLPEGHPGVPETKWCRNRMLPFMCVGASADKAPGQREPEEYIEVSLVCLRLLLLLLNLCDWCLLF